MWTFVKWSLMVGLAVIIVVPLLKMGIDAFAKAVPAASSIATYADKA